MQQSKERKKLDKTGVVVECESHFCKETFELLRKGGNQRRFCSGACREKLRSTFRFPPRKDPLECVCESRRCGREFLHWKLGQHPRFCSVECQVAERDDGRRDMKVYCVEMLGGCCLACGYNRNVGSLHFHHIDRSKKAFKISEFSRTSIENRKHLHGELMKCALLCANCHAEAHAGMIDIVQENNITRCHTL